MQIHTLFIILVHCVCIALQFSKPIAKTFQGIVRGTYLTTNNGRQVAAFLGIPYAEPPVDNLRFRNPLPARPWRGIYHATQDGSLCPQLEENARNVIGSENCLFLNVYTPQVHTTLKNIVQIANRRFSKMLPVMVWIYGGSFISGSNNSTLYGPEFILDRNVVLVTMNYRVGVLGFLSTGDTEAPGNFGLKDQVMALRWVQENIAFFGGDPKRVTLFGQSSGGVSVNLHALSDLTVGLFHRYIIHSGSALAPWAYFNNTMYSKYSVKLAEYFGCSTDTSSQIIDCLRKVNISSIVNTNSIVSPFSIYTGTIWGPTDEPEGEGAFLTDSPKNLIAQGKMKDYPWISGVNRDEALIFTHLSYVSTLAYTSILQNMDSILKIYLTPYVSNITESIRAIKQFYFSGNMSDKSTTIQRVTEFFTDAAFTFPEQSLLNLQLKYATSPSYFYVFDYRGEYSYSFFETGMNSNVGVEHGDELLYLFPIVKSMLGTPLTSTNDLEMKNIMVNLWTSFASTGVPQTTFTKELDAWESYSLNKSHLRIGNNVEVALGVFNTYCEERMNFWSEQISYNTD